jgi:hypothetical protein
MAAVKKSAPKTGAKKEAKKVEQVKGKVVTLPEAKPVKGGAKKPVAKKAVKKPVAKKPVKKVAAKKNKAKGKK